MADPAVFQRARDLYFEEPLDKGIKEYVITLLTAGVETFESCEGGAGHAFPEPTVKFAGATSEGFRAMSVALAYGLPLFQLRRVWGIWDDGCSHGPWWEMTFSKPGSSQALSDRCAGSPGKGSSRPAQVAARREESR
jgi:hypothetical protein